MKENGMPKKSAFDVTYIDFAENNPSLSLALKQNYA